MLVVVLCVLAGMGRSRIVGSGGCLYAPTNGDGKHRFTSLLTRQAHEHAAPHGFCLECSTAIEPWEGQAGARTYLFAAREVGDALARVARGESYRSAAQAARVHGGRVKPGMRRRRTTPAPGAQRKKRRSRLAAGDGHIVANWIDAFTPVLANEALPTEWPKVLIIDSKAFTRGGKNKRRFNVLGAVGIEDAEPGRWAPTPKVWKLAPSAKKDTDAWVRFLRSMSGTPEVIVSDADGAIKRAIAIVWPGTGGQPVPEHRLSEHHAKKALEDKLPNGVKVPTHPIWRAFGLAPTSPANWDRFVNACKDEALHGRYKLVLIMNWLRD